MAGIKLKSGADFCNFQATRMCLHNDSADPTSDFGIGRIYFNTSSSVGSGKHVRIYDGEDFRSLAYFDEIDERLKLIEGSVDTSELINNLADVQAFLKNIKESDGDLMTMLNGKLSTSGGTITSETTPLTLNRTVGRPVILYQSNGVSVGVLGFDTEGNLTVSPNRKTNSNYYDVLHSGNIGSYKSGDSAKLGGQTPSWVRSNGVRFSRVKTATASDKADANADLAGGGMIYVYSGLGKNLITNSPSEMHYGHIWQIGSYGSDALDGQLAWDINHNSTEDVTRKLWWRARDSTNGWTYAKWHQIAFTDSNVASATKLETPRTIWGQSFDGTGNIDASLYIGENYGLFLNKDKEGIYLTGAGINWHSESNTWLKTIMLFNSSGYVGIGTTDPQYKLDVTGEIRATSLSYFNGGIRLNHATYLTSYIKGDDGSTTTQAKSIMGINASNDLLIGYGMQTVGDTGIYGKEIYFAPNGEAIRVRISESGAVYINSAVASGDTEKLIVGGVLRTSAITRQMGTMKRTAMTGDNDSLIIGDDKGITYFRGSEIAFQTKTGGSKRNMTMTWNDGDPRVGIGTSTPTERLHVVGNLYVTGNIIADGEVSAGGAGTESGTGGGTSGGGDALIYSQEFTPSTQVVSIAHNLSATKGVIVQVWEQNADGQSWSVVLVDIEEVDSNNIKLNFGRTETTLHKVVVMG